jgi:hypothetical protein
MPMGGNFHMKIGKNQIRVTIASVIGLGIFLGAVAVTQNRDGPPVHGNYTVNYEIPAAVPAGDVFVLRETNGFIAVYTAAQPDKPQFTTGIRVSSLRQFDQRQLRRGIRAYNNTELLSLLEDFGS